MKYKVIGWTYFDGDEFPDGDITFAVRHAIVDDIRKRGYLFSGYDHQEMLCCCPVLNDGKKRSFSQRGFADVMAEAHGECEPYSYARYMMGIREEYVKRPSDHPSLLEVSDTDTLREEFTIEVSSEALRRSTSEGRLALPDPANLRYVERGDEILLCAEGMSARFAVTDVDRRKDLPEDEIYALLSFTPDPDERRKREQKFAQAPTILELKLVQRAES